MFQFYSYLSQPFRFQGMLLLVGSIIIIYRYISHLSVPFLLPICIYFSCSTVDEKPCEDVTFGDCPIKEENILKVIDGISVTGCQGACLEYADCVTYRFSYPSDSEQQSHCWLLIYDYRQECRNSAAPKVK